MRRNGEQATDGEANHSLGAPAGSGIGPAQEDQTGDVPPRVRGEYEQLFGEDSDEEGRQSHPAFSEDERMDPEDRVGAMQVLLRLEEPAKAAGSGLGPEASEDSVGSLVERLCRVDLCEVFSPPRVGVQAVKYGLDPGEAMDLATGWDFNKEEDRDRAEIYVDTHNPLIVIGSPPCTPFSLLQNWNPETPESKMKWEEGVNHMRFVSCTANSWTPEELS